ncbi:MAG: T9SS type A sorting domain-containing protein [Bacteroidia bacterium]
MKRIMKTLPALLIFLSTFTAGNAQLTEIVVLGPIGGTFTRTGFSVSIANDGSIVVIGAPGANDRGGAIGFFEENGSTYTQKGLTLVALAGDYLGSSLDITDDGSMVLAGASTGSYARFYKNIPAMSSVLTYKSGDGVAYSGDGSVTAVRRSDSLWIFSNAGTTWNLAAGLKIPATTTFGPEGPQLMTISEDGNLILVGMPHDKNDTGGVAAYHFNGTNWAQLTVLRPNGHTGASQFGSSVSMSSDGSRIVVGGQGDDAGQGAFWTYTFNGTTISGGLTKQMGTGATGNAGQGAAVSVSEDGQVLLIGGPADNNFLGAAWEFHYQSGNWSQVGNKITPSVITNFARFGSAIDLSEDGTKAIIGAYDQERAYVYGRGSVGVDEQQNEFRFKLSPCPAQDNILLTGDLNSVVRIRIMDLQGRVVKNLVGPFVNGIGIDIQNLDQGAYIVCIDTENDQFNKKILIAR